MTNKLAFALHAHQPVGNFEHVFEEITEESYQPFLETFRDHGTGSLSYHVSGILLSWWQDNRPGMIDLMGDLVDDGRLEPLAGGFYEPILPLIPEADRRRQINLHRNYLQTLFDYEARGLWLTERVWYPDLPSDLARAGIDYLAVDDNHFRAAGWSTEELSGYYHTEYEGKSIGIFPIKQSLRYAIPFHDIPRIMDQLQESSGTLHTMADDAEKFGSWPETQEWVYQEGWLERFLDAAREEQFSLLSLETAYDNHSSQGLVYLPTASYGEMEEWALNEDRREKYQKLTDSNGSDDEASFRRGGHFHNFLTKFEESNRLHKRMNWLSRRYRDQTDRDHPPRDLMAGQCNDAYWHGVFGGLYLPHLRGALWEHVGSAHSSLASGDPECQTLDYDGDGNSEVLVESADQFLCIDPYQGGRLIDWHLFDPNKNLSDVLTRRWPSYLSESGAEDSRDEEAEVDTIHHKKTEVPSDWLEAWSPDPYPRANFQLVSITPNAEPIQYQTNDAVEWVPVKPEPIGVDSQNQVITLRYRQPVKEIKYSVEKRGGSWSGWGFDPDGQPGVLVNFGVNSPDPERSWLETDDSTYDLTTAQLLSTSLINLIDSLSGLRLTLELDGLDHLVSYPLESISRSESGAEKIFQGVCLVLVSDSDLPTVNWRVSKHNA